MIEDEGQAAVGAAFGLTNCRGTTGSTCNKEDAVFDAKAAGTWCVSDAAAESEIEYERLTAQGTHWQADSKTDEFACATLECWTNQVKAV